MWVNIKSKTIKLLDKLQLKFLRVCLSVSRSTPIPMLYHQTGTLFMSNRILWKKLNLLHHVATLPEGTLARDFYDAQVKYKLQNTLVSECQDTLRQFGITNIQSYTKYSFKKITKAKIIAKNSEELT